MSRLLSSLTLNQKLALAAFVLGAVAAFAEPQPGHAVTIAPRDLAVMVQRGADRVAARELAGWIIAGRADFRLVDVRTAEQYATYHIPGAEHVALASLPDQVFSPTEKVVLYAEDGTDATQAWFLLRAHGARNAYILQGGLASWKADVLFPTLAADADPLAQQRNEQLRQVAAHFGGRAMAAGSASSEAGGAPQAPLPKVEMPAAPAGGAPTATAPARKKKEGC